MSLNRFLKRLFPLFFSLLLFYSADLIATSQTKQSSEDSTKKDDTKKCDLLFQDANYSSFQISENQNIDITNSD